MSLRRLAAARSVDTMSARLLDIKQLQLGLLSKMSKVVTLHYDLIVGNCTDQRMNLEALEVLLTWSET